MNGFKINDVSLWRANAGVNKLVGEEITVYKCDVRNHDFGEEATAEDDKV